MVEASRGGVQPAIPERGAGKMLRTEAGACRFNRSHGTSTDGGAEEVPKFGGGEKDSSYRALPAAGTPD